VPVHNFFCDNCHVPGTSLFSVSNNSLCVQCHSSGGTMIITDDGRLGPLSYFDQNDLSNTLGSHDAFSPSLQTSHTWAVKRDQRKDAGATPSTSALYYSNYGGSYNKVTCTKCHNPHAEFIDDGAFHSYLRIPDQPETVCQNCHLSWAGAAAGNGGELTHPLGTYNVAAAAGRGVPLRAIADITDARIKANLQASGNVMECSTCHGVHWTDSDATTDDGRDQVDMFSPFYTTGLNAGDGNMLVSDGRKIGNATRTSTLCQACHPYETHGDVNKIGCLDCHSGHSYNDGNVNFKLLRYEVSDVYTKDQGFVASPASVSGMNYPTGSDNWKDATGTGYCESCHDMSTHSYGPVTGTAADCNTCHNHGSRTFAPNCTTCHEDDNGLNHTGANESVASHNLHLSSPYITDCADCHGHNGSGPSHRNDTLNFTTGITGSEYAVTPGVGGDFGTNCSTNNCHDSDAGEWVSGNLGTTGDRCNDCHGSADTYFNLLEGWTTTAPAGPTSGAHASHVGTTSPYVPNTCDSCHVAGSETAGHASHVDTVLDVDASLVYDGINADCTNSCHTTVAGNWASGQTLTCDQCHDATGLSLWRDRTSGRHESHYNIINEPTLADYGRTGNNRSTIYNFGCGECHPAVEATSHLDGSTRELNTAKVTYSGGVTGTCDTNACHQDGRSNDPPNYPTANVATPPWNGIFPASEDKCIQCHENGPNSGAHSVHVVGIHYKDIYAGDATGGRLRTDTSTRSHGNPATSTTLSCKTCHTNTVVGLENDQSAVCAACHDGTTAALKGNNDILNYQMHVNGTKNIDFVDLAATTLEFKTKAQLRDSISDAPEVGNSWSRQTAYKGAADFDQATLTPSAYNSGTQTCSSISCHNGYDATWATPVGNCVMCHTQLPQ